MSLQDGVFGMLWYVTVVKVLNFDSFVNQLVNFAGHEIESMKHLTT